MAQNSLLDLQEMKPTPRNQLLGLLADALTAGRDFADKAKVPAVVPLLGGQGLGSLLLGKAPEELTNISYGNMPLRINPLAGRTASFVPEIKPGRKEQVADLAMALQAVPGGNRAALSALGAVDTGVGKAMFIGPTAKTWDKAAADAAQKMEKAGADPRAIWSETGTFKGPDGKWRQEISDSGSIPGHRLYSPQEAQDLASGDFAVVQRQKALLHPPLSAAYPDTKNIGVRLTPGAPGGYYTAGMDYIEAGSSKNGAANRSVMLHELQHAIQQREGFAQGGSPTMAFLPQNKEAFALLAQKRREMQTPLSLDEYTKQAWGMDAPTDEVRKAYVDYVKTTKQVSPSADRAAQEWAGKEYYRRLAGEAEARATQARMNMTPAERRATFPFDSYDVPVDQLIVRGLLSR